MVMAGQIQAVVMAAGKGSRMTDLTAGGAKCLLPVANMPLVWFPLQLLQNSGFQSAIVTVPDTVKAEVAKIPEKYSLSLKLEVVGIPVQEEWGTADTLRHIHDKLVGSDILVVSGDLVSQESITSLADLHRANGADLSILLNRPAFDLNQIQVPGSKSTKYKKERDLVGLSGQGRLCLFKAEADVEDEIRISSRILRENPRMTVHTNLQDAHLYLIKKWVCDDMLANDKNISTIKGELLPKLVRHQFVPRSKSSSRSTATDRKIACYAAISDKITVRVNNIPAYWEACRLVMSRQLQLLPESVQNTASQGGERSQIKESIVGAGCTLSDKISLTNVALSPGCSVGEKARITNSVIMEGARIEPGAIIQDSIVCECGVVGPGCEVRSCIVGRGLVLPEGSSHHHQILLDTHRMMEV